MHFEKATESLQAAELCYTHKLYNATVNRGYYAMFQSAIIALEKAGVKAAGSRWSHTRVQSTFAQELTRSRKIYPRSLAGMLNDGLTIRNEADYGTASTSKRQAYKVLRWTRDFVKQVEQVTL